MSDPTSVDPTDPEDAERTREATRDVEPTVVDEDERIDRERLRRELEIDGFEQGMQG